MTGRAKDASSETVDEYRARILRYQAGADPLVLQAKAPDVLAALVEDLSAEQLGQNPAPGKWCIREIVAHLAEDELVGAYRIRLILSAPGTAIQAFDQDVWARTGRYSERDITDSLVLYRTLRFANLQLLQSLTSEEWDMFGVHAERGIESLRDIARYFAGHDINHFQQIELIRRRLGETTSTSGLSSEVRLRNVEPSDLPIFYEQQLDPDATQMAAFPSRDRAAFDAHWATNILGNPAAVKQTILVDGQVAGNIGSWPQDGVRLVGYWIGKEYWGKGVATRALAAFLKIVTERPLYAHVARHNVASIRVLEKCGFNREREDSAAFDGKDAAELVLILH